MKNILLFIILCSCFLLIGISCKKSADPIPEPEPSNNPVDQLPDPYDYPNSNEIFACLLDGEVWKPAGAFNNPSSAYHAPSGQLNLSAKKISNNIYSSIALVIKFSSTGDFDILNSTPYVNESFCLSNWEYSLDTTSYSNVTIDSISVDEGFVIGTFEFTAITEKDCPDSEPDTVKVTAGRFKTTL